MVPSVVVPWVSEPLPVGVVLAVVLIGSVVLGSVSLLPSVVEASVLPLVTVSSPPQATAASPRVAKKEALQVSRDNRMGRR